VIEIGFRGWFQARLATDPDPYDEPRGVSGYVHAYAGEPDLDRVICFQPPPFVRSHGRPVRVTVDTVLRDTVEIPGHPLLGAPVDLLDAPKFEGRNGVVADDGLEPIYPFRLAITSGKFRAVRAVRPADPDYPYLGLFAGGVEINAAEVRAATGEPDLLDTWRNRLTALHHDEADAEEPHRTGISERVEFLERNLDSGGGAARFFAALMRYRYPLAAPPEITDPHQWLDGHTDPAVPWSVSFWLGGWDADVLCGFVRGTLRLPDNIEPVVPLAGRPARISERRP